MPPRQNDSEQDAVNDFNDAVQQLRHQLNSKGKPSSKETKKAIKQLSAILPRIIDGIGQAEAPWSIQLFLRGLELLCKSLPHRSVHYPRDYLSNLTRCILYSGDKSLTQAMITRLPARYAHNLEKLSAVEKEIIKQLQQDKDKNVPTLTGLVTQGGVYRFLSTLDDNSRPHKEVPALRKTLAMESRSLDTLSAMIERHDSILWNTLTLEDWIGEHYSTQQLFHWLSSQLNGPFPEDMLFRILNAKGCFQSPELIAQLPMTKLLAGNYLNVLTSIFDCLNHHRNLLQPHVLPENYFIEHVAAPWMSDELFRLFMEKGALNVIDYPIQNDPAKNTWLHWAISTGDIRRVKLLLKAGGSLLIKNSEGVTPYDMALHPSRAAILAVCQGKHLEEPYRKAIYQGNIHALRELLADPTPEPLIHGDKTLLHYACIRGEYAAVQCLLEHMKVQLSEAAYQEWIDAKDSDGRQAIEYSVLQNDKACTLALIRAGATPLGGDVLGDILPNDIGEEDNIYYQGLMQMKPHEAKDVIAPPAKSPKIRALVIKGGGYKGIAYGGVLEQAEEDDLFMLQELTSVSGTSIGAIVALLIGCGMTAQDIKNTLFRLDLRGLIIKNLGRGRLGLSSGKALYDFLSDVLQKLFDQTLNFDSALNRRKDPTDPTYLKAEMVTHRDLDEYNRQCEKLGKPQPFKDMHFIGMEQATHKKVIHNLENFPDSPVLGGGLASATLPGILQARVLHKVVIDASTGRRSLEPIRHKNGNHYKLVDGGLLANFSFDPVDHKGIPSDSVLGLYLVDHADIEVLRQKEGLIHKVKGWKSLLKELLLGLNMGEEIDYVRGNTHRVMLVDCLNVGTFGSGLDDAKRNALIESGRAAVKEHVLNQAEAPFNEPKLLTPMEIFKGFLLVNREELPPFQNQLCRAVDTHGNTPLHYAMAHLAAYPDNLEFQKCIDRMKESGADVRAQNHKGQQPEEARLRDNGIVDGFAKAAQLAPQYEICLPQPRGAQMPQAKPLTTLSLPSLTLDAQHLGYQLRHFAGVMEFLTQRTNYVKGQGKLIESILPHSVILPLIMRQAEEEQGNPMGHRALQAGGWSGLAYGGSKDPLLAFYREVVKAEKMEEAEEDAQQLYLLLHKACVNGVNSFLFKLRNCSSWRQYDKEEDKYSFQTFNLAKNQEIMGVIGCLNAWSREAIQNLPKFGTREYRNALGAFFVASSPFLKSYYDTVITPIIEKTFSPVQEVINEMEADNIEDKNAFVAEKLRELSDHAYGGQSDSALREQWLHQPCLDVRKPQPHQRAYEAFCHDELLALSQGLLDSIAQVDGHSFPLLERAQQLVQSVSVMMPDNYWVTHLLPTDLSAFAELALSVVHSGKYDDEVFRRRVRGANGIAEINQTILGLRYCPATGVHLSDNVRFLSLLCIGRLPLHYRDLNNSHLLDYCVAHHQPNLLHALYRHYGQPSQASVYHPFMSSSLALIGENEEREILLQQLSLADNTSTRGDLFVAIRKVLKAHREKLLKRETQVYQQSYDYLEGRITQRHSLEKLVSTSEELSLHRIGKKRYYIMKDKQFRYDWKHFQQLPLKGIGLVC